MKSVQSSPALRVLRPASEPVAFDVYGPLPAGVTLLEASAGTGKTFTIASLVTRFVAEGTLLERLLVVTFTRMATGELRDRVRHRLVVTASGLAQAIEGAKEIDDPLVDLLATGTRAEIERRHTRLTNAIANFDAATIDTTHGFCLHMLMSLGVVGDVERDVKLVEDTSDLLEEVVDDLYVRRFWKGRDAPLFDLGTAMDVAKAVVGNSAALVLPNISAESSRPAMRRRLAQAVILEMDRRKRVSGILTYDDLLTRLRGALTDPVRGPAACRRLSDRYEIVLVDEFQDTDPVQWEILERAFSGSTLVLIGDPKQAIYSFRGADVYAYLAAAGSATRRATLNTNWRSDQGLIDAYDALFADAQLGHTGIVYYPCARRFRRCRCRHRRRAELHASADQDPRSPRRRDDQGRVCQFPRRAASHSRRPRLRRHFFDLIRSIDPHRSRRTRRHARADRPRQYRRPGAHEPPSGLRARRSSRLRGSRSGRRGWKCLRVSRRDRMGAPACGHRQTHLETTGCRRSAHSFRGVERAACRFC